MRVGVTKVYILPKAAIVTGPVYMVWFVSPISCSTLEKKNGRMSKICMPVFIQLEPIYMAGKSRGGNTVSHSDCKSSIAWSGYDIE